ncbi:MAG: hypothetical protein EOO65_00990, partial [Methanosarcinales archaeon]
MRDRALSLWVLACASVLSFSSAVYPHETTGFQAGVQLVSLSYIHGCVLLMNGGTPTGGCWGKTGNHLGYNSNPSADVASGLTANSLASMAAITIGTNVPSIKAPTTSNGAVQSILASTSGTTLTSVGMNLIMLESGKLTFVGSCTNGDCWSFASSTNRILDTNTNGILPDAVNSEAVVGISNGLSHSCALFSLGGVRCSGDNSAKQLGQSTPSSSVVGGSTVLASIPLSTLSLPSPWTAWVDQRLVRTTQVAAGAFFTCVLLNTGHVSCFGSNSMQQLGLAASVMNDDGPHEVVPFGLSTHVPVVYISAGYNFSCALFADGRAACWGACSMGLCASASGSSGPIFLNPSTPPVYTHISCGLAHICAADSTSAVTCWGRNMGAAFPQPYLAFSARTSIVAPSTSSICGNAVPCVVEQLHSGPSSVGACAIIAAGSPATRSLVCWGAHWTSGVNASAPHATARTVPLLSTWTLAPSTPILPVVTGVVKSASVTDESLADIVLDVSFTFPPVDKSGDAGKAVWVGDQVCHVLSVASTTATCTLISDQIFSISWPALVTYSWQMAPGAPLLGMYVCPRPIVNSVGIRSYSGSGSNVSLTLTGSCFKSSALPWAEASSACGVSVVAGKYALVITACTPASVTVSVPPVAGISLPLVLFSGATQYSRSAADVGTLVFPPPTLTSIQMLTGGSFIAQGGDTLVLTGSGFGLPGFGVSVSIMMNGGPHICSSVTHVDASTIRCVVAAWSNPAVTSLKVALYIDSVLAGSISVSYQKFTVSSITPNFFRRAVNTTSVQFRIAGTGLGNVQSAVTQASIGGAACALSAWSSTGFTCSIAASSAIANGSVVVRVSAWSALPSQSLWVTILEAPAILRVGSTNGTRAGDFMTIFGKGLAVLPGSAESAFDFGIIQQSNQSNLLSCNSADKTLPSPLGAGVTCKIPRLNEAGIYIPYVKLDGVVVSNASVFLEIVKAPAFQLSWQGIADLQAAAIPS